MINLLKALVILFLLGVIGGGGYGAYYFLIERPRLLDAQEIQQAGPVGQPTPDPSTPDFEKAQALKRSLQYPEAREALVAFLTRYPDSSHRQEAETMLGDINLAGILSGQPGPEKVEYIVQRGDVLDRVAHKTKSNPELIFQANGLDRIMLRIGQKLEIPQVDFFIDVRLKDRKLILLDHGRFFKSYPLLDFRPLSKRVAVINTKVQEKIAFLDGKRVPFGSKEFPGSLRSLTLSGQPGYTIYPADTGTEKAAGSGLGLAAADTEELHTLVSVGTPVTINAN
jgi:LysM repeat protein